MEIVANGMRMRFDGIHLKTNHYFPQKKIIKRNNDISQSEHNSRRNITQQHQPLASLNFESKSQVTTSIQLIWIIILAERQTN